jgi:hypothetical protein
MVRFFGADVDTYADPPPKSRDFRVRSPCRAGRHAALATEFSRLILADSEKAGRFGRSKIMAIYRGIAAFQAENGAAFQKSAAIRS